MCLLAGLAAACGGDRDDPGPSPSPGQGQTPNVRSGARLGWDQPAQDDHVLRAYQFLLFVDGAPAAFTNVECSSTPTAAGYQCSGRLPDLAPGRHTLQIRAGLRGAMSRLSAALSVNVGTASTASLEPAAGEPVAPAPVPVCAATRAVCFDVDLVGSIAGELGSPVATPDGRLLVVQDRQAVYVVDDTGVSTRPALESRDEIESLAIGPAFAESHTVYLATLDAAAPPGSRLVVTRYREVRNLLGEPAVIVPGLPLAIARLAIDAQERIYVAGSAPVDSGATDGLVVRVTGDGRVPWDAGQTSIALAEGLLAPRVLVYDDRDGVLRLAGQSPSDAPVLRRFQVQRKTPAGTLDVRALGDEAFDVGGLAMVTTPTRQGALIVDAERRLAYAAVDGAGALTDVSLVDFPPGSITGVAAAPGQAPYLLARDVAAGDTKIFRLRSR